MEYFKEQYNSSCDVSSENGFQLHTELTRVQQPERAICARAAPMEAPHAQADSE